MKKEIKKLSLNKKTISNLNEAEMTRQVGGGKTKGNNNTCAYSCVLTNCFTCNARMCGGTF